MRDRRIMPMAFQSGNPLLTLRPGDKIICTQTISSVEPFGEGLPPVRTTDPLG